MGFLLSKVSVVDALKKAIKLHQSGRLDEAAGIYEQVLKVAPNNADALNLLGTIASTKGDHERSVSLISKAIQHHPTSADFHCNLGIALRRLGRFQDGIEAYRKAIELNGSKSDIHFALGKSYRLVGDDKAAEQSFEKSIELNPSSHSGWLSLLNLLFDHNRLAELDELSTKAVNACGNVYDLHLCLGVLNKKRSRFIEAALQYELALKAKPNDVTALTGYGTTLISLKRLDHAQAVLARASEQDRPDAKLFNAIGLLESAQGNYKQACNRYELAIEYDSNFSPAYTNQSVALYKEGRLSDALTCINRGIETCSTESMPEALVVQANALLALGRVGESETSLRKAIEIRDGWHSAHSVLLMLLQHSANIEIDQLIKEHQLWNQKYGGVGSVGKLDLDNLAAKKKLRLGFVSQDLGQHPVGYFTVGLFENIDKSRFETFVYSSRMAKNEPIRKRIESAVYCWRETSGLDDDRLYDLILNDKIDVLIDLAGHTDGNRLLVFARRAAPIQMTWAGYVGTTGLAEMDYLISDSIHSPELEQDDQIPERVLRMPHGYICFDPPTDEIKVQPSPALEKGFITFGAMARPAKVNADVLSLWAEILNAAPGSELLLCYRGWLDEGNQKRVLSQLERLSVSPDRIRFEQRPKQRELLEMYHEVDIALDTFPYSAGLTTLEALYMGVPTVTMPGERFCSRHSASHLTNVGLQDWIANDVASYRQLATTKANTIEQLANLRLDLRAQLLDSPVCDHDQFAKDFDKLICQAANHIT